MKSKTIWIVVGIIILVLVILYLYQMKTGKELVKGVSITSFPANAKVGDTYVFAGTKYIYSCQASGGALNSNYQCNASWQTEAQVNQNNLIERIVSPNYNKPSCPEGYSLYTNSLNGHNICVKLSTGEIVPVINK